MFEQLKAVFMASAWWGYVLRIGCFYILAWLIHRLAQWMAGCLMRLIRFAPRGHLPRPERQATLRSLVASAISFVAFATATLASLGQFVQADTLFWIVGLFSAAFGLGARALIGDMLGGLSFIVVKCDNRSASHLQSKKSYVLYTSRGG
jgi:small-conductance mechanosensitive channel